MVVLLILTLVIAGAATAAIYRNPTARVVAGGAWTAGRAQAAVEARQGYKAARSRYEKSQTYLRRPHAGVDGKLYPPGPRNLRWWVSGLLAVTAGTATAAAGAVYAGMCATCAGGRTVKAAVAGGRAAVENQREAHIVDAEVIEPAEQPQPEPVDGPVTGTPADPAGTASTTEEPMADQMISGAGDKMSHGQLLDSLTRVSKHLSQGASELDVVIASLTADQLDAQTIAGLRSLQELLSTASSQASALHGHVKTTHGQVAEAINAAGVQNVAAKEHYAEV